MSTTQQFVEQNKTMVALTGGAVLGLLLGLAIGWWWWPVEWTNSTPGNLRSDFQSDYVVWVAGQYAVTRDLEEASSRLGVEYWKEGQLAETLDQLAQEQGGAKANNLLALKQGLEEEAAPVEPEPTSLWDRLRPVAMVCGVFLLILAFVGGVYLLVARSRKPRAASEAARRGMGTTAAGVPAEQVSWGADGPPLSQFVTTYTLGDDHYDPSFSVELESSEFVGECGVGISETIGVGAPNKVTAFELWLFDKNDIRTVTKVLMSDYAFHDEALRTKLAPKGEPVLAGLGKDVILETNMLRVQARIVETEYGAGNLPPDSFFDRLTVELAAWVKPGQEGEAQPTPEINAPIAPPTL